jgi:outer membrane protein assembly factor BamB
MKNHLLLALFLSLAPGTLSAGDFATERLDNWHQWRGPLANGAAPHGDPPVAWDEQTNVKWKAALPGKGSATPVVWGDQVFVVTAVDTGRTADAAALPAPHPRSGKTFEKKTQAPTTYYQFLVLCFDRQTGKERWRRVATEQVPHEGIQPTHSYAAGSPTTDGRWLYVSFGSRGIYCYDLAGKLRWQRDLGRMHTRYAWGEAVTPVIHGDTLIVNWDQEADSFLIALDARTGATRWKKDRDDPTSWNTPVVVDYQGRSQVVVNATKRARGYDLATGEDLWQCGGQTVNAIPSPVVCNNLAICMSGYGGSACRAIPLDARGDITATAKIAWRHDRGTPYVPSPLLVGDRLYFTQSNNALLTCLDARTGKVLLDRERLPGLGTLYASPMAAAGRIYLTDRDGTTLVLRHGNNLEILATNRLADGIDASPVVVGRQLFLRGHHFLYCIEAK